MPLGWTLRPRDPGLWGDCGNFLFYGMTSHRPGNDGGLLRHDRTGPFIPPMFISSLSDLLVTDTAKRELEASDLEGLAFRPVELHVTRVDWQAWDTDADEPGCYPPAASLKDSPSMGHTMLTLRARWDRSGKSCSNLGRRSRTQTWRVGHPIRMRCGRRSPRRAGSKPATASGSTQSYAALEGRGRSLARLRRRGWSKGHDRRLATGRFAREPGG